MNYEQAFKQLAAAVTGYNAQNETSIRGLEGDITGLNDKIADLQNRLEAGKEVTAEDMALLDAAVQQGAALTNRFTALDDLTPPTVPTA